MPKSNRPFWKAKLNGNVKRDRKNEKELLRLGWNVLRFWEHQVEDELEKVVEEIRSIIASQSFQSVHLGSD